MGVFDPESPLMEILGIIADLVILNIVTVLCCIPVITAGAAMTGMHYVLLKIVRQEHEGYVLSNFYHSFRQNLRQATAVWCLFLAFAAVLALDLYLTGRTGEGSLHFPAFVRYLLVGAGIFGALTYLYVFPLLARFNNTVKGTIRNAMRLVVSSFPCTFCMALVTLAVPAAVRIVPGILPLALFLGLSGPGFLCALLYSPVFLKIEEKVKSRD